jgi:hypothetical protein
MPVIGQYHPLPRAWIFCDCLMYHIISLSRYSDAWCDCITLKSCSRRNLSRNATLAPTFKVFIIDSFVHLYLRPVRTNHDLTC